MWKIQNIGKAGALATAAASQFTSMASANSASQQLVQGPPVSNPQADVQAAVGDMLSTVLAGYPSGQAVRISVLGLQTQAVDSSGNPIDGQFVNSLNINIEPINGFVE